MRFIIILTCLFSLFLTSTVKAYGKTASKDINSVGLIYGGKISTGIYHLYDWLVVNPDNSSLKILRQKFYLKHTAKLIAYVSIGETGKSVSYYNRVKKYAIGKNKIWNSKIMDIENKNYRNFILDEILPKLAEKGFDGFMFDTMDSYKLVVHRNKWPKFRNAEVEFIKDVRKEFPNKIIVVNRGFSIMNRIHGDINGVIAESLYKGLNKNLNYINVDKGETNRLLSKLKTIKDRYKLPVIVVDYVNPKNKSEAVSDAKKISDDGFIPWVTNKNLTMIGVSNFKFIKRRVLVICNSKLDDRRPNPDLVRMPLEYLGFVPVTYHVNGKLPGGFLSDRYAGAVVIVGKVKRPIKFYTWVRKAIKSGLKIFFVENFGFPERADLLSRLGIKVYDNEATIAKPSKIIYKEKGSGFEVPLTVIYHNTLLEPREGKQLISMKNLYGQKSSPFSIMPWGGYALDNSLVNNRGLWVYNPFKIFAKLFRKEFFPVPDITTENGRIILFSQIDGDADFGHTDFNPDEFIASYVTEHILEYYKIPVTLSVITADLMGPPYGLHVKEASKLRKIFRHIFKYKNVEIASHTFSHPFNWPALVNGIDKPGYQLPVPDYKFSVKSNVEGSVNWINKNLAPKNKKVRVILWSGDNRPPETALKMAYDIGIYNVNGDNTDIVNRRPFLMHVKPMGKNVGNFFQANAAITNEDIYTNLWLGPFWGFRNVIQTFKLTEKPRRLKPIYIYYHWYSGQKIASVKALKTVYEWALKQHPIPEFVSQYAKKTLDFRAMAIAKSQDGWIIRSDGNLRTVRVPKSWGYPNMNKSIGVVGYRIINGREYVSLDNSGNYYLVFGKRRPAFRLVEANGMVRYFKKTENGYTLILKSDYYVPLHFKVQSSCSIKIKGNGRYIERRKGNIFNFKFIKGEKAYVKTICR
ncbi:endo alpha-1,4 polygalactosaminidase [Candidatus Acidulodesulfobacterium sp. H_13]|uniref:endo alpha-1,4 polygalactosaminidase n=1 Tax=Candidatus Acidulodesulfobacterium sp. H_13 TaxID=3395470 RepID=UPI003AF5BFEA